MSSESRYVGSDHSKSDIPSTTPRLRTSGMYGPPLSRKRKMKATDGLRQCIRPSVKRKASGLDGRRCALVLFRNAAPEGFFRLQASKARGSTVVSSSLDNSTDRERFINSR